MTTSNEYNIFSIFADTAGRRREHPAIIYLGNRFTYGRVKDLAERFAASLNELGVAPGQKVMMYIPNSIQWVISWLGIQKLGAVAVPITPIYTPHDLQYIANDSDAQSTENSHRDQCGRPAAVVETVFRVFIRCHSQG
jgi:long-chain acyl-CoA synthetase